MHVEQIGSKIQAGQIADHDHSALVIRSVILRRQWYLSTPTLRSWLRKPEDMLAMLTISATTFLKVHLVSALWQVTMNLLSSPLSCLGINFKEQPKESPKSSKIRARTTSSQISYWLWQWGAHFFFHSSPTENVSIHASEFATSFWNSV